MTTNYWKLRYHVDVKNCEYFVRWTLQNPTKHQFRSAIPVYKVCRMKILKLAAEILKSSQNLLTSIYKLLNGPESRKLSGFCIISELKPSRAHSRRLFKFFLKRPSYLAATIPLFSRHETRRPRVLQIPAHPSQNNEINKQAVIRN